jgi:hypothetical protein
MINKIEKIKISLNICSFKHKIINLLSAETAAPYKNLATQETMKKSALFPKIIEKANINILPANSSPPL